MKVETVSRAQALARAHVATKQKKLPVEDCPTAFCHRHWDKAGKRSCRKARIMRVQDETCPASSTLPLLKYRQFPLPRDIANSAGRTVLPATRDTGAHHEPRGFALCSFPDLRRPVRPQRLPFRGPEVCCELRNLDLSDVRPERPYMLPPIPCRLAIGDMITLRCRDCRPGNRNRTLAEASTAPGYGQSRALMDRYSVTLRVIDRAARRGGCRVDLDHLYVLLCIISDG
jgi:hypothetical protein